ncbi:uroporphyrinogen-III C-methyltransferase [Marinobacterium sediminicola]|uniref:Uroporphyrin-3 C-methyltransferase n=1 Tax=Marinobacterium sediminicola TaxID=518898 RepID=A0ABY1RZA8_9GAMM|nr:uroporphyrinogen-III C-methyltransferase [Marinobacterium sediminicola]ULG69071.1 uroporphyrinogen-III C-methyltransferase [Marinobacterium sediminicola]SMR73652.1 uroporphyrin-3 C-methyltransferase [Marinobacterium sediminicola]
MKETRNETTEQQDGETSTPVPDDSKTPTATTTEAVSAAPEQPADNTDAVKEPAKDAPTAPSSKEKRCGATWPGKLALLLSVVALGGGAYLVWEGWQLKQQNNQLQSQISQQVETLIANGRAETAQTVASVSQQLGQLQAKAEADKANIDELQDRLTRSIQQVTADAEVSRKDWLLAEVEYLLRLANQRVLMEQTASGALTLLKSADDSLRETDDVTLYDVRKALAEDIAALEAVPRLDTEGVFLKLAALNRQVDELRVTPITDKRKLPALLEEITPESVEQSWGDGLKASWNKAMDKFETLIVIQHHDEPVKPLMSPEQTFFLQQNLHLMLEQAQMALLQRKQQAYDASLTKAHDWISTHFDAKNATTQAMLRGLEELKAVNIAPELPDISGSLTSLKTYLRQMQDLRAEG